MKSHRLLLAIGAAAFLGVGAWFALRWLPSGIGPARPAGSSAHGQTMNPLEKWCADQLRKIAADLLTPDFAFASLQLELPATVTLTDVSLTADGQQFIKAASMRLEIRDTPRKGSPLVIKTAAFVDPRVKLIAQPDGGLVGFTGFIKSRTGRAFDDGGSSRPSDIFAIREIDLKNGFFEWRPAGVDDPLVLDQITANLALAPDTSRPGWYSLDAAIDRSPIIELTWKGGISIDTGELGFDDSTLSIDLSEEGVSTLTPSIQDLLRTYELAGRLTVGMTGKIPPDTPDETDLAFDVKLTDAHAAIGEYAFPIDSASAKATYRASNLGYDNLRVNAFGGRIDSTGAFGFANEQAFRLHVSTEGVQIAKMLRVLSNKPPKYEGDVALNLDASGARADIGSTLNGEGTVTISQGNLGNVAVVGALTDAVDLTDEQKKQAADSSAAFTLKGDRLTLEKFEVRSRSAGARGHGDIHYSGRLDLLINAGRIKRPTGEGQAFGDVLTLLADHMLPFHVGGSLEKPKVTPRPLGLPIDG